MKQQTVPHQLSVSSTWPLDCLAFEDQRAFWTAAPCFTADEDGCMSIFKGVLTYQSLHCVRTENDWEEYLKSFLFLTGKLSLQLWLCNFCRWGRKSLKKDRWQACPLNFYREHCLLVRCFISAAIILLHLHPSLCCAAARPPCAVYHATVTSWLEAGGNFWFNSASGGLVRVYPQTPSTCSQVRRGCCRGEKNVRSLYRLNTHRCPYWAAVIQDSSTLIRVMRLIN